MTQLQDDCFAFDDHLIPMAEALAMLSGRLQPITDIEEVALADAVGRILAEVLIAEIDVPSDDNSAVDGYAFDHRNLHPDQETRLPIIGRAAAGHPADHTFEIGGAARIFTGAPMPATTNTVVMQEDVVVDGNQVVIPPGLKRGANRRKRGEDTKVDDIVLPKGKRLRPQDIGIAASTGHAKLNVFRRLRVALFSSGDELIEPGQDLRRGGVYDSNRFILKGLLQKLGCVVSDIGILPDRLDAVRDGIEAAAHNHDLLITSGGMSTGEEDHIKAAIDALGSLYFWRLAIKPGRPIALGQARGTPFIGLPGNPVAAMVCFLRFARPIILELAGGNPAINQHSFFDIPAGFEMTKKPDRREWLRAQLETGPDGRLVVQKYPTQGSGVLRSMVESDGLVEIAEATTEIKIGDMVKFLPFSEVLG